MSDRAAELQKLIDEGNAFLAISNPVFDVEAENNTDLALNNWLNKREALFMVFQQVGVTQLPEEEQALLQTLYQLGEDILKWLEKHRDVVVEEMHKAHQFKENVHQYAFPELQHDTRSWES